MPYLLELLGKIFPFGGLAPNLGNLIDFWESVKEFVMISVAPMTSAMSADTAQVSPIVVQHVFYSSFTWC